MAEQANLEEDKASWTIKSVPVETRKLAVACAAKQGQTMAEWLAKAVRTQANLEEGERVLPPAASWRRAGGMGTGSLRHRPGRAGGSHAGSPGDR